MFSLIFLIKPGIQERGTESGERGEWGECYIPGKNVLKHSGECRQTFREMSPNIPGNVAKLLSSLISECFTVHYLLISSNQSEYLYSFPVCKNVLPANPKETFQSQLSRIIVVSRSSVSRSFSQQISFLQKQMKILAISTRSSNSL